MKLLLVFVLFVFSFAEDDRGPLTNIIESINNERADLQLSNMILDNPHLKPFEKEYYIDKENEQVAGLNTLSSKVEQFRKNVKNEFPFAGYASLDTNLYNRFTKEDVENEQYRKIGSLLEELKRLKTTTYPNLPAADPLVVAEMKHSINEIDKAQRNNELRLPHTPLFARPYEDGKIEMTKLNDRIKRLSTNIQRPLSNPEPTQEEIAALNRLNEKMDIISKRIHSMPSPAMEVLLLFSYSFHSFFYYLFKNSNF
jgi:hypothetical protein